MQWAHCEVSLQRGLCEGPQTLVDIYLYTYVNFSIFPSDIKGMVGVGEVPKFFC